MKKFIKWFLFSLVLCGGLALAICYMVIPNETKSAADIVIGYLNTPIGIAGGTTITIGAVLYVLFKVIYDRYRDRIISEISLVKSNLKKEEEEHQKKIEELEEQLKLAIDSVNELKEQLLSNVENNTEILKLIPNKKVQERLEELYGREERTND